MKLWCTNQFDFDLMIKRNGGCLPKNSAAISIIGTEDSLNNYLKEPFTKHSLSDSEDVLNLEFDDITKDKLTYRGVTFSGLTDKQAKDIVLFLEKVILENKDIYVHCRAGRSRSQAIVRYVESRWNKNWEMNPDNPCNTPNYYVLGKIREAENELREK